MTRRLLVLFTALALLAPAAPVLAAEAPQGEVLVKFLPTASPQSRRAAHARAGALGGQRLAVARWEKALLPPGADPRSVVRRYRLDPAVETAEYALPRYITRVPNDLLNEQWGLNNTGQSVHGTIGTPDADIDAPEAWDLTQGSKQVVAAVLDIGIDQTLGDLSKRLVPGFDFVNGDSVADDDEGHGTAVASIIGAIGNNDKGMTGVNWKVRLMPVKVCDSIGKCDETAITHGIEFAINHGANVINMSLACEEDFNASSKDCPGQPAGNCISQMEDDAISDAFAAGVTVVDAAGNCGSNIDDATKAYPCANSQPANICAGATNQDDDIASFSNFGPQAIDVGAPGENIVVLGRTPPGGLFLGNGTSFSSPMTAGVAALLLSRTPMTPLAVRNRLVESADPGMGLTSSFEGGRVNAFGAVRDVFLEGLEYATHPPGDVMLLADVTGDGRADLIRGTAGVGFEVAKNKGKKHKFAGMKLRSTTPPAEFTGAGDADGDGKEDIILGDGAGFRVIRAKNKKGKLLPVESWSTEELGDFALTGDVNGDGRIDVVNHSGGTFDALLSTGTAFATGQVWSKASLSTATALGDADGDGQADLIIWSDTGSATAI